MQLAVYSVKKQLFIFGFLILGIASFVVMLEGFSSSSVVLIANYPNCPSPPLAIGQTAPAGYVPCDYSWKGIHAVLSPTNWNLFQCLGSEQWAPSVLIYLDKTTSSYAPPCHNTQYFQIGGSIGVTAMVSIYVYSVRFQYASKQVISFVKGGQPKKPTAYGNALFDFLVVMERTDYSPAVFGELETAAQLDAAQKIKEGKLHAVLLDYIANDERGRAVFVMGQSYNDSLNFGEPHTVQIGMFPRNVAGTALATGIYMGMETRAPLNLTDLKKYGLEGEIPQWQRSKLLVFLGYKPKSEQIPWYQIDDCDARRKEVQEAAYKGDKAADRIVSVKSLREGKLGAFVEYHDSLKYLEQLSAERARGDMLEEKLAEMEANGIYVDAIERKPKQGLFKWPVIPTWLRYTLAIAGLGAALYVGYYLVGPLLDRYFIQLDLNQINTLLQSGPESSKAGLLQAQKELQQAYVDLQANGASAYGEVAKALSDAGQAIAQAVAPPAATATTSVASSINSNSTSTTTVAY